MLLWSQSGYEWIYEEIYGVDFFTSTQAMEEQGLGDGTLSRLRSF
jgi:hypothetical protein